MSSFEIGLLSILIFFCTFTIISSIPVINRICTCIENCARSKAIGKMDIADKDNEVLKNESGEKENC